MRSKKGPLSRWPMDAVSELQPATRSHLHRKLLGVLSLTSSLFWTVTGCDRSKGGSQSECGSIIVDQNSSHSTQEHCLLVALVQTIYTTYDNDGIHFGVGTAMAAPAGSIGYSGGGGRRSGNSYTISSRHSDDGCTSSGRRDGNGEWSSGSTRHTERGHWWRTGGTKSGSHQMRLFVQTQVHGVESENAPRFCIWLEHLSSYFYVHY